jgi:hypothetical protein
MGSAQRTDRAPQFRPPHRFAVARRPFLTCFHRARICLEWCDVQRAGETCLARPVRLGSCQLKGICVAITCTRCGFQTN